LTLAFVVENS
jgi:hypothetical protein